MKDIFSVMNNATKKAFQKVGGAMGQEKDNDLRIYNSLKPEHFTELMKDYGEDNVIQYIQNMELKRTKGG